MSDFDRILKEQHWLVDPPPEVRFRASEEPLLNAALAISICAYPQSKQITSDGKAAKYYFSLLSYIFRISRRMGYINELPAWAKAIPSRNLQGILDTGYARLMRTMAIRDVIYSALVRNTQQKEAKTGERTTFSLNLSPDLKSMRIEIPIESTEKGTRFVGGIPDSAPASLRQTILYHLPGLRPHLGPATSELRDDEIDYQNIYNRYLISTLKILPIVNLVKIHIDEHYKESEQRNIAIDQILMRKAIWAADLSKTFRDSIGHAVHVSRLLGLPSCACSLVQFYEPECVSRINTSEASDPISGGAEYLNRTESSVSSPSGR